MFAENSFDEDTVQNSQRHVEFDSHVERFRKMKERMAEILGRAETTQQEFDKYMGILRDHETCKYMTGVHGVMSLCNFPSFQCKFRSTDKYGFSGSDKFECKREKLIKLRNLL